MSKSAVAKASTIVYFGPSDTLYCRVGSIEIMYNKLRKLKKA